MVEMQWPSNKAKLKLRENFEVHLIKAVIIGVSKYDNLGLQNLKQVKEEVDATYQGCINLGVPEDSIVVLNEPEKKSKVEIQLS